jgi:hypothetical protein
MLSQAEKEFTKWWYGIGCKTLVLSGEETEELKNLWIQAYLWGKSEAGE